MAGSRKTPPFAVDTRLMPEDTRERMDAVLCEIDDNEIAQGRAMLSVLVRLDDGNVGGAFWKTVEKHKLRRPGEKDLDLIARLEQEAWAVHAGQDPLIDMPVEASFELDDRDPPVAVDVPLFRPPPKGTKLN